jgi:hypothetical protein
VLVRTYQITANLLVFPLLEHWITVSGMFAYITS